MDARGGCDVRAHDLEDVTALEQGIGLGVNSLAQFQARARWAVGTWTGMVNAVREILRHPVVPGCYDVPVDINQDTSDSTAATG